MIIPGRGIIVGKGVYSKSYDIQLLKHEFGHILQYRKVGLLAYYGVIGKESLASASMGGALGWSHDTFWTETWANYLSSNYFSPASWNVSRFPIKNISTFNYLRLLFYSPLAPSQKLCK